MRPVVCWVPGCGQRLGWFDAGVLWIEQDWRRIPYDWADMVREDRDRQSASLAEQEGSSIWNRNWRRYDQDPRPRHGRSGLRKLPRGHRLLCRCGVPLRGPT